MASGSQIVALFDQGADPDEAVLDRVFFALSDPVRRAILERLDGEALLVSELATAYPKMALLLTGVEDPESNAHSENESVHLAELMNCCASEAILLGELARDTRA